MKHAQTIWGLPVILAAALILAGCPDTANPDGEGGSASLTIVNSTAINIPNVTWNAQVFSTSSTGEIQYLQKGQSKQMSCTGGSDYVYFAGGRTAEMVAVLDGQARTFTFTGSTMVIHDSLGGPGPLSELYELYSGGNPNEAGSVKMTIKNQSFTKLTGVSWNNESFSDIDIGANAWSYVRPGSAYIFFKRSDYTIDARTQALVVIPEDEDFEFTFTDNTVIVEASNPSNYGPLGMLNTQPAAPEKPALTGRNGTITAVWTAVPKAVQYKVYYSASAAPPAEPAKTVTGTSAEITGLTNGETYYVWVKAVNAKGESELSVPASCAPAQTVNTLTWSGNWTRISDTEYVSSQIGDNATTCRL
jgi:hypothetical protein